MHRASMIFSGFLKRVKAHGFSLVRKKHFRPYATAILLLLVIAASFPGPVYATTCPTSGADVVITTNCTFDAGTYTFSGTLTINPGVTVTAASNVGGGQVVLVSDNIRIDGTLTANGTGYAAGACGGSGTGPGAGNTTGSGGGYGGYGGSSSNPAINGQTYGSVKQPTDMGSSGGYGSGCFGGTPGTGAGSIKLSAPSGTVIVAGTVSANGTTSTAVTGGGAGGSIWIDAGTLTGGGTISAIGGNGSSHGGGGGGRVALYYNTDSSTGTRSVYGGTRGGAAQNGGAGTLFLDDKDDGLTNGELIVDNNNLTSAAGTAQVTTLSQTYDLITIRKGANYVIPNFYTLTLPSGGAVAVGGTVRPIITINAGGTLDPNAASWSVEGLNVANAGTVNTATSLTFTGADLTLSGTGTFQNAITTLNLSGFSTLTHNGVAPNFNLTSLAIPTLGFVTVGTAAPYYPFGSGFTTLNVTGTYTADHANRLFVDTLNVNSGGIVTHGTNTSTTAKNRQLDISATTTIRVNAGGSISANNKGFTESACAGGGLGPGGGAANGAGGGYGGRGGTGSNANSFGVTYGSVTQPTDIGSAGGPAAGCFGGFPSFGGGAIKITTPGTLIVAGTISSNGSSPTSVEGGGSGGSVWIDVPSGTLTGGGTISANGGAGTGGSSDGGGGGGRVALYYTTDSGTGTRSAYGGSAPTTAQNGGAGTVYKFQTGVSTLGDLIVDNNNLTSAAGTAQVTTLSQTYDNITIKSGANYAVPNLFTFTLPSGGVLNTGGGGTRPKITVESGGTFNPNTATWVEESLDLTIAGTVTTLTSLTMTGADLTMSGTGTFSSGLTTLNLSGFSNVTHNGVAPNFNLTSLAIPTLGSVTVGTAAPYYPFGSGFTTLNVTGKYTANHANRLFLDTLNVNSGGTVTHATNTSTTVKDRHLDISATTTIRVNAGGSISANSKGFTESACAGAGLGPGGGGTNGTGGGYGGNGGAGSALTGGGTYGSVTQPTDIGSAGGPSAGCFGGFPGFGGGAIKLTSPGTIIVAGTISSNGNSPTSVEGGPSGGSVWIDASGGTLTGGGTISVNGGSGSGGSTTGGGGGGRMALYYTTDSGTGTRSAFGGARALSGVNGGAGTIYKFQTGVSTLGDLIVDDNNLASAAGTTQVTTLSQSYDTLSIKNGANYIIPSGFTLAQANGTTLLGGGTALPVLNIQSGGTFNPPSSTLTIDGLNVTQTGVFNTLTNLTIKNSIFSSSNTNITAGLATLTVDSGGTYQSTATTNLTVTGNITVKSGGLITSSTNTDSHVASVNVSAANLDIQTGGSVSVAGKGFGNGFGTGRGNSNATAGSGGGYGGAGGASSGGAAGGATYGSNTQPIDNGSSGGNDTSTATVTEGGNGGGVIKLVLTGTLTLNGTLSANGATALGTTDPGGGGAGGSIWYDVTTAILNTNVTANGGAGSGSGATGGGGGGGGRIAAYYIALTGSGTSTVTGGAKGGTGAAVAGSNGSAFSQVNPPVVTVTAPNGGESFTGGEHTDITYTSVGTIDHFRISLSTDGGSSFSTVVTNSATSGPFDWTVSSVSTTLGRIKVEAMNASDVALASDVSNANFTITSSGGGGGGEIPAGVTIGRPNGGEQLAARSTYTVLYSSQGSQVSAIRLSYSTDGGSAWTVITSSASKADGFYNWSVPDINAPSVLMKAEALSGGTAMATDTSDQPFSISGATVTPPPPSEPPPPEPPPPTEATLGLLEPNGGETVVSGRPTTIRWSSTGAISSVRLSYSDDGGTTYTPIATGLSAASGSYAWTVPVRSATTTSALVMVTGDALTDISDGTFTITPPASTQEQQATMAALGLQEAPLTMSVTARSDELAFSFSSEARTETIPSRRLFALRDEGTGLWVVPATSTGTVNAFPKVAMVGRMIDGVRTMLSSATEGIFGATATLAQVQPAPKKYALGTTPYYQTPVRWTALSLLTGLSDQKNYALTVFLKPADPTQPALQVWTASAETPKGLVRFDVSKSIIATANDANPDPGVVSPGTVLTYRFVLKNVGNRRAMNVTLIDPFPPGTTYVARSMTADGRGQTDADDADVAHLEAGQAVWRWYALDVGASHTVTVKLKMPKADGVTYENSGSVTAEGAAAPSVPPAPVAVLVKPRGPYCGDKICNADETTLSCVQDCPAPVCGNARCEASETSQTCREDCVGVPRAVCGNAICEAPETYRTCLKDCSAPTCGDQRCEYGESSTICIQDCRPLGLSDEEWRIRIENALRSTPTVPPPADTGGGGTAPPPTEPAPPASGGGGGSVQLPTEAPAEGVAAAAEAVMESVAAAIEAIGEALGDVGAALVRTDETMHETPMLDAIDRATRDIPVVGPSVEAVRSFVKFVRVSEPLQKANTAVVTPAVATTTVVSTTAAVGFAGFARYGLFLITHPLAYVQRRRRKAYGTVYNAGTKMPIDLAIVRLLDAKGERQIATRVTDRSGRYLFLVPDGDYRIEVRKEGFSFPPARAFATASGGPYLDVHLNPDVSTADGLIAKNLPMEPTGDLRPASQVITDQSRLGYQWALVAVGPGLAVAEYIATPRMAQIMALLLHLALFAIFARMARRKKPKSWGTVTADGKPVKQAVVRVVESDYNKTLDSHVTDANGRYAFLVGQNRYFVTAEHPGYEHVKTDVIDFTKAPEPDFIAKDIELRPKPAVSPPASA